MRRRLAIFGTIAFTASAAYGLWVWCLCHLWPALPTFSIHTGYKCVAVSKAQDNRTLILHARSCCDEQHFLWDAERMPVPLPMPGDRARIFSVGGRSDWYFYQFGADLAIWDVAEHRQFAILPNVRVRNSHVIVTGDPEVLCFESLDDQLHFVDFEEKRILFSCRCRPWPGKCPSCRPVAVDRASRSLFWADGSTVHRTNYESGITTKTYSVDFDNITDFRILRDENKLVAVARESTIEDLGPVLHVARLWDLESGQPLAATTIIEPRVARLHEYRGQMLIGSKPYSMEDLSPLPDCEDDLPDNVISTQGEGIVDDELCSPLRVALLGKTPDDRPIYRFERLPNAFLDRVFSIDPTTTGISVGHPDAIGAQVLIDAQPLDNGRAFTTYRGRVMVWDLPPKKNWTIIVLLAMWPTCILVACLLPLAWRVRPRRA